jgi:hypothetical protein
MNNLNSLRNFFVAFAACLTMSQNASANGLEYLLKQITHQEDYSTFEGQAKDFKTRIMPNNTNGIVFGNDGGYCFELATWGEFKRLRARLATSALPNESFFTVLRICYATELNADGSYYMRFIYFPDIATKQLPADARGELTFNTQYDCDIYKAPAKPTKVYITDGTGAFTEKNYAEVAKWIKYYRDNVQLQHKVGDIEPKGLIETVDNTSGDVKGITISFQQIETLAADCGLGDNDRIYITNVAKAVLVGSDYYYRHSLALTDVSPVDGNGYYAANLTTMCPPQCGKLIVKNRIVAAKYLLFWERFAAGQKSIEEKSQLITILLLVLLPLVGLVSIMTFIRLKRKS